VYRSRALFEAYNNPRVGFWGYWGVISQYTWDGLALPCSVMWIRPDGVGGGEGVSVSAMLKFATASLSDMISRKTTNPPNCRSFSWFYEFILRK
jgi:hypothetical protein